ncbi:hypothetical protein DLM86_00305 [Paenibacillus flagellatus]|uniref:Uncharacterized protein n=2 Tax=Paenibacillus flagellatus TaxID=2211139 RepID=A0A2V5KBJ5_9BACL|nr:hypothetical protein DLM86_00305 [Paenibacillus flagellatus]
MPPPRLAYAESRSPRRSEERPIGTFVTAINVTNAVAMRRGGQSASQVPVKAVRRFSAFNATDSVLLMAREDFGLQPRLILILFANATVSVLLEAEFR